MVEAAERGRLRDDRGIGQARAGQSRVPEPSSPVDAARAGYRGAILDGRQPAELQLDDLREAFPSKWTCSGGSDDRAGGATATSV